MESFYRVEEISTWEQVIEKSKFIGVVYPVNNTSEVKNALEEVKQNYPNARHYVYAFRLKENNQEKSSDDGEPQGTGGKPVLEILQHKDLWNALVVVVRYFGGILLGTGGLTRAYGGTARQTLEQAKISLIVPYSVFLLNVPYAWHEKLKYQLQLHHWIVGNEEFTERVKIEVYIPQEEGSTFENWLMNFTSGQISWQFSRNAWGKPNI